MATARSTLSGFPGRAEQCASVKWAPNYSGLTELDFVDRAYLDYVILFVSAIDTH